MYTENDNTAGVEGFNFGDIRVNENSPSAGYIAFEHSGSAGGFGG